MAEHWFHKNRGCLKTLIRVVFGMVWFIDGSFKFIFSAPSDLVNLIQNAALGQPAWLGPWFGFWMGAVSQNPAFWLYFVGIAELLIGLGLILGGMRKVTYMMGFLLSLFIWAVPEGLGGPYGPSSTDIGTGIIYAMVFVALMVINAGYGPSRLSVDYWLEKRIKWWHKVAEFE